MLILCVGEYTRRIESFQGQDKTYTGTMTFGAVTASFDLEKAVELTDDAVMPDASQLEQARQELVGVIQQFPPVFSAVKQDGKRLYTNARSGTDVELQPRQVEVHHFEMSPLRPLNQETLRTEPLNVSGKGHPIWYHPDYAEGLQSDFKIVCGKGTYIRSMAFDMGRLTGAGAYLSALRRTDIGDFSVENAWEVNSLVSAIKGE